MTRLLSIPSCLFVIMAFPFGEVCQALEKGCPREVKLRAVQEHLQDQGPSEPALPRQLQPTESVPTKGDKQYVKLEVKGTLDELVSTLGVHTQRAWMIKANGSSWTLDFGKRKDLLELAKRQKGQTVVITGELELRHSRHAFGPEAALVVGTMKGMAK